MPGSLLELIGYGGVVRVKCRKCGREAQFNPGELSRWFRLLGGRDDWKTIRTKFVCRGWADEGCGSRNVSVTYELDAPDPPRRPPLSRGDVDCPTGIDPEEWAKADYYERKRLVRRLRN